MDFDLTDEQRMLRETARAFAEGEIAPRAREADRQERFDPELARQLGELGFIGAVLDPAYGGGGLDYVSYGLLVEEIGRVDSSARTIVSVNTSLVGSAIDRFGTDEQKRRWLPGICAGTGLGCFGLTEPDSGSDAAGLRTRARRTADGWLLNGQKMWISLADFAAVALVFARSSDAPGHRGISCFLVPTDTPGFSAQRIHGKLGLCASDVAAVSLDDVELPADALLGEEGRGFRIALTALESGRFSVAAGAVGICQGALDASVAYARERNQFGRPIASFQLVQALLADMRVRTDAARMLLWRAGHLKDTGQPNSTETSIAKLYASEAAVHCANLAIQVHGGAGYVDDHPVERLWRDARVTTLYEGTTQVQQLLIGRALTGVDALVR
jgi:alkylation response protein AidB-like acyl-CoA dehydrogenase